MPLHECPGPDRKKKAIPEDLECPTCGREVEIWSNEEKKVCPSCGATVARTRDDADGAK